MKIFNLDSIILIENGLIYEKSTAALKISKHLYNGYQLLYIFIILPKVIRDWVYNYIAKNRYNWFGKKDTCMIPSEKIKNRFLTNYF